MRTLLRNKTKVYYALYNGEEPALDADGMETGESVPSYDEPVPIWVNVSPNKGEASAEPFGADLDYTKIVVTDDMSCPIQESSQLWIDDEPNGTFIYAVVRVARSLNHIAYAVKPVDFQAYTLFSPNGYDGVLTADSLLFGVR